MQISSRVCYSEIMLYTSNSISSFALIRHRHAPRKYLTYLGRKHPIRLFAHITYLMRHHGVELSNLPVSFNTKLTRKTPARIAPRIKGPRESSHLPGIRVLIFSDRQRNKCNAYRQNPSEIGSNAMAYQWAETECVSEANARIPAAMVYSVTPACSQ